MIQVVLLTTAQKDMLIGKKYAYNQLFNPIQDVDDNWIISIEERDANIYTRYKWVNNCPLIDFKPKPYNFP